MTSSRSPSINAPSELRPLACQEYHNYCFFDGCLRLEQPPATVSGRGDCPDMQRRDTWLVRWFPRILPYHISAINDHDSTRCQNSTAKDSTTPFRSPSSTSAFVEKELQHENRLVRDFGLFVREAQNETFADGMDSKFAGHVQESILKNGATAVAAWERTLHKTDNAFETGEEVLRQLGVLRHSPSHGPRLRVLTDCLNFPDPRIRDAAGIGLSFLDDPAALPKLKDACSREQEIWVRQNLELVIEHLEQTSWRDS